MSFSPRKPRQSADYFMFLPLRIAVLEPIDTPCLP